jgi:hypothetical protein
MKTLFEMLAFFFVLLLIILGLRVVMGDMSVKDDIVDAGRSVRHMIEEIMEDPETESRQYQSQPTETN